MVALLFLCFIGLSIAAVRISNSVLAPKDIRDCLGLSINGVTELILEESAENSCATATLVLKNGRLSVCDATGVTALVLEQEEDETRLGGVFYMNYGTTAVGSMYVAATTTAFQNGLLLADSQTFRIDEDGYYTVYGAHNTRVSPPDVHKSCYYTREYPGASRVLDPVPLSSTNYAVGRGWPDAGASSIRYFTKGTIIGFALSTNSNDKGVAGVVKANPIEAFGVSTFTDFDGTWSSFSAAERTPSGVLVPPAQASIFTAPKSGKYLYQLNGNYDTSIEVKILINDQEVLLHRHDQAVTIGQTFTFELAAGGTIQALVKAPKTSYFEQVISKHPDNDDYGCASVTLTSTSGFLDVNTVVANSTLPYLAGNSTSINTSGPDFAFKRGVYAVTYISRTSGATNEKRTILQLYTNSRTTQTYELDSSSSLDTNPQTLSWRRVASTVLIGSNGSSDLSLNYGQYAGMDNDVVVCPLVVN